VKCAPWRGWREEGEGGGGIAWMEGSELLSVDALLSSLFDETLLETLEDLSACMPEHLFLRGWASALEEGGPSLCGAWGLACASPRLRAAVSSRNESLLLAALEAPLPGLEGLPALVAALDVPALLAALEGDDESVQALWDAAQELGVYARVRAGLSPSLRACVDEFVGEALERAEAPDLLAMTQSAGLVLEGLDPGEKLALLRLAQEVLGALAPEVLLRMRSRCVAPLVASGALGAEAVEGELGEGLRVAIASVNAILAAAALSAAPDSLRNPFSAD
jgi:hypothetical protein